MEPKMRRFWNAKLSAALSSLALVCLTGFNFIESWIHHARGTLGFGIIFILAVGLALVWPRITRKTR